MKSLYIVVLVVGAINVGVSVATRNWAAAIAWLTSMIASSTAFTAARNGEKWRKLHQITTAKVWIDVSDEANPVLVDRRKPGSYSL